MIDPTPHLERFDSYEQACREFRWQIPDQFNIASAISRRHKDSITRIALSHVRPGGINTYTFGGLDFLSDKLASLLAQSGVRHGDAVAVIAPQSAALLVAHFGILKLGAIVVPLSPSLPPAELQRALSECQPKAILAGDFWRELNYASSDFTAAETSSDSPAFIFFMPGPDGDLTGVIHSHGSLIGQLTAFEMLNGFSLDDARVFWTASDWVSPQVLLGLLYPALWYGCSLVSDESTNLSANDPFALMSRCEVTDAFIPSVMMIHLNHTPGAPLDEFGLKLRRILTTPDQLSQERWERAASSLGARLNIAYGTPETGLIAGSCEQWPAAGLMASVRAAPGHSIEIMDEQGRERIAGQPGRVALHRPDPALFLRYLNDSEATRSAFAGEWFITRDAGNKKEDGDLYITPSS
jgi:acetyl-CoA synthetase